MSAQSTRELIARFVAGPDRGKDLAARIERALGQAFPDDERFEDFLLALASYQPGGGDYLYDEQAIMPLALDALRAIDELASNPGVNPRADKKGDDGSH